MILTFLSFILCVVFGCLLSGVFSALLYMANNSDYDFIQNKAANKFREAFSSSEW